MNEVPDRIAALTPKQRAYLALKEMEAKLAESERASSEPIAVVGVGCRFPGGAENPEAFWKLLQEGREAIVEVPKDRYDVNDFYEADLSSTQTMNTRWGGYLDKIAEFDAGFFGISVREASGIDPQQRLLMEVSWEALEDAGLAPATLAGSSAGVFMALASWDYAFLHDGPAARGATGLAFSIAANRLSYFYDFHGPSMSIDSACSSSLVALDLACQGLRGGDIDMALVGGANFLDYPWSTVSLSQAGFMSPDGRCKTFDASANGYVRGEGCGVVVLKRLSDALAGGHDIRGLVCGVAINHGGRSNGLTAPNGLAQTSAQRLALKKARIQPRQLSYVEAHGTGTSLGDVVEVESLWAAVGEGRGPDDICLMGSVKTNIGHLEPASGVAGLIKVLLALGHEEIPPHLNVKQINPHLHLDPRLRIVTARTPWPRTEVPRYAGACAFGFGGTNGFAILREPPVRAAAQPSMERAMHVLTLSARSRKAVTEMARRYSTHLAAHRDEPLADVCYTAATGRAHFVHRLAVWSSSNQELRETLEAITANPANLPAKGVSGEAASDVRVAFVFPGSSYPGMGRQLYETQPSFRKTVGQCDEFLRAEFGHPVLPALFAEAGEPLSRAALFTVEYALAQLWKSWGVEPALVTGHGVGEYVAASVAGVFDWKDGLRLAAGVDAAQIACKAPRVRMISRITGQPFESGQVPDAKYWSNPERTAPDLKGCGFTLTIGADTEAGSPGRLSSLRQGHEEWETLLSSVAALYVAGAPVDWKGFDRDYPRLLLHLPTYAFERKHCWLDPAEQRHFRGPFAAGAGA